LSIPRAFAPSPDALGLVLPLSCTPNTPVQIAPFRDKSSLIQMPLESHATEARALSLAFLIYELLVMTNAITLLAHNMDMRQGVAVVVVVNPHSAFRLNC